MTSSWSLILHLILVTLPDGLVIQTLQVLGEKCPCFLVILSRCLIFSTVLWLLFDCLFGSLYRRFNTELLIYVNAQTDSRTFNPLAWWSIIKYNFQNICLIVIYDCMYNSKSSVHIFFKFICCQEVWLMWCRECAIHFSDITDITWLRNLAPEFLGQLLVPSIICPSSTNLHEWNVLKVASIMH